MRFPQGGARGTCQPRILPNGREVAQGVASPRPGFWGELQEASSWSPWGVPQHRRSPSPACTVPGSHAALFLLRAGHTLATGPVPTLFPPPRVHSCLQGCEGHLSASLFTPSSLPGDPARRKCQLSGGGGSGSWRGQAPGREGGRSGRKVGGGTAIQKQGGGEGQPLLGLPPTGCPRRAYGTRYPQTAQGTGVSGPRDMSRRDLGFHPNAGGAGAGYPQNTF